MRGKTALVTGAGSGIGRATALAFAQHGANVIVADVNLESYEETAELIKAADSDAFAVVCDISQPAQVEAMIAKTINQFGQIEFAINNAGVAARPAPAASIDEDDWHRVINIKLNGTWYCMKHEIAQMLKQGKGAILNTASLADVRGRAGIPPYTASKHTIVGLSNAAALDYAQTGIRINVVCPGLILTGMTAGLNAMPEMATQLIAKIPMGHMGQAEDIANVVLWLCTDGAAFVTGQVIVVDGGETVA